MNDIFLQQFSNNIKFNYTSFDRVIIRGYKYLRISARISRLTIKKILMMIEIVGRGSEIIFSPSELTVKKQFPINFETVDTAL